MTGRLITLPALLEAGFNAAGRRWHLLLLLSLGAGVLMRLAYVPTESVLLAVFEAMPRDGRASENDARLVFSILNDGLWRFLVTQVLMAGATAAALVPWARALEGRTSFFRGLEGRQMRRRILRSFFHLCAALAAAVSLTLLVMVVLQLVAIVVPLPPLVLTMLFAGFAIWGASLAFTVGHAAVAAEARDFSGSIMLAFLWVRLFQGPATAALVVLTMIGIGVELTLGSLITVALPHPVRMTGGLIILFGLMFAVSAVHLAALLRLPDPRQDGPPVLS